MLLTRADEVIETPDRQDTWLYRATLTARPYRRGDRKKILFAAVRRSLMALSGHPRRCNILSAFGPKRTKVVFGAEWLGR
jgi:hypothetical protein